MIVLAEFEPLDTTAGTRKTLRACSANDASVTGLNNLKWRPAIIGEPSIGIRLFKGDFDGEAAPSSGSIELVISDFVADEANVRKFLWQGAPLRLYAGTIGQAWPWTLVFEGEVARFSADTNTVKLSFEVNTRAFDADVLTLKYAGTGGAEGGVDLKDKNKPFLLGRCFNVEPYLINAVDNVYQFSGYGPIENVTTLYERGSDFGVKTGDFASYALLVAATIAPGSWATCNALGMIRLGAPAFGVITGDVDGDKEGGTWRRKTGEIILRIAANSGVSGALIETASFTALDTALGGFANQGRIGIFIEDQTTVLEVASRLAAPCNAQVGVSMTGKLFVGRIVIGSPVATFDAQQRQLPRVTESSERGVSPPFSYLEMGYARSWRVHSDDEISYIAPAVSGIQTNRFPDFAPTDVPHGSLYYDILDIPFRLQDSPISLNNVDATFNTALINSLGYEQVRDQGVDEALVKATLSQTTKEVSADYLGNITGDQPVIYSPTVLASGVSVKITDDITYSATKPSDGSPGADGGTATVDNTIGSPTKGDLSLSLAAGSVQAVTRLSILFKGNAINSFTLLLKRKNGEPPTGGTINPGKQATVPADATINTTTYADTSSAAVPSLPVASGESLFVACNVTYSVVFVNSSGSAPRTLEFIAEYATDAIFTTPVAFGASVVGYEARQGFTPAYAPGEFIDPVIGSVSLNQSVVVSAGTYFLRVRAKCNITGRDVVLGGENIMFEAKVP